MSSMKDVNAADKWDFVLAFPRGDKAAGINIKKAYSALDVKGFDVEIDTHLLKIRAPDDLLAVEAEYAELQLGPGKKLSRSQRMDMTKVLLDHVPMEDDTPGKPAVGSYATVADLLGDDGFVHRWVADGLCELVPLHDRDECKALWKATVMSRAPPIPELRNYYGEHITLYFLWMKFFTRWLWVPGMVGLGFYLLKPAGMTVEDNPWIPFFSLFIVIWGVLFLRYWQRECAAWTCRWGTLDYEKNETLRPEHHGVVRISKATDKPEVHVSFRHRLWPYTLSVLVTGVMLAVAFAFMVCSLNLQGYIHDVESVFHIPYLYKYSQAGAVFDPDGSMVMSLVPVVGHSIVILILNSMIYSRIAVMLTDYENHRTEAAFENALILKRFLFEAFDCYLPLFYLAFYEQDVMLLRTELASLYTTDAIRRVLTETVLPLILQWLRSLTDKVEGKAKPWSIVEQIHRDEYEQFDDYLEMVIEFGYITLFASAFPLASILSIGCNMVEIRSDLFKLTSVVRRPLAHRASSIGTWGWVLSCMVWTSVLTNCLIFAFASNQMSEWFPTLFTSGDDMKLGSGRQVVATAWAIEHVIIVIALFLWAAIPSMPGWVRIIIERASSKKKAERQKLLDRKRRQAVDDYKRTHEQNVRPMARRRTTESTKTVVEEEAEETVATESSHSSNAGGIGAGAGVGAALDDSSWRAMMARAQADAVDVMNDDMGGSSPGTSKRGKKKLKQTHQSPSKTPKPQAAKAKTKSRRAAVTRKSPVATRSALRSRKTATLHK